MKRRVLSTNEWIKKLWYIYTMEYYSSIERNTFESVLMSWTTLEPIIQSEVSQKVKYKYCMKVKVTQFCLTLATPWTIQSLEFSRPEYWSRYFPSPGDPLNPGIKSGSPALQVNSLSIEPQGKPKNTSVGSLSLLQWIFPTQESNWLLLQCRWILYQMSYRGR